MHKLFLSISLLLAACSSGTEEKTHQHSLTEKPTAASPRIGFPLDSLLSFSSEAELINAFGDQVKRGRGLLPEGMGAYPNTLLFPDTKNEVELVWADSSNFENLSYLEIEGSQSDWQTVEGIRLGTQLQELEALNGQPFHFYGFAWDYGGRVVFEQGNLAGKGLQLSLYFPGDSIPPALMGDRLRSSTDHLAQKANLSISQIRLYKQSEINKP